MSTRRRELIGALVVGFVLSPHVIRAQRSTSSTRRIALIAPARTVDDLRTNPYFKAFSDELARLGFAEGSNLQVERYSGQGQRDRYPDLAREVVSKKPDAILTSGTEMTLALRRATATIPIVTIVGDPVVSGLTRSLARPGGNVTGVTIDAGIELYGKRLELLRAIRPDASRLAYLTSSSGWKRPQAAMVRSAAQASKLTITHVDLGDNLDDAAYLSAFDATDWTKEDVLLVSDEPEHLPRGKTLIDLATNARIPTNYPFRDLVLAGGLMAYYRDLVDAFRQLAAQMAQILSGESPAEMPFRQPTGFRLSLNTKAAARIGLVIPQTMLATADEVIE